MSTDDLKCGVRNHSTGIVHMRAMCSQSLACDMLHVLCCLLAAVQSLRLEPGVLLRPLLPLLTSGNEEAVVEAARAVSNLARGSAYVQDALLHGASASAGDADSLAMGSVYEEIAADSPFNAVNGDSQQTTVSSSSSSSSIPPVGQYVLQALVLLLAHSSWEVVYNMAGALLNLTAATGSAKALHKVSAYTPMVCGLSMV